ncbi:hypothetical protein [uncultured Modestobacter sp.]|uniref:hypothetical protein n=1 Tax=uncultured Modestobacter sp. TaxID=380048 RepID=UPI0026357521|nr:hypothetical protein [uncultured Modestobacter sp.]
MSEAGAALHVVGPDLHESLLVSAYDLYLGLLPDAERAMSQDHGETLYALPHLLIVDSGGYELNPHDFESGEQRRGAYLPDDRFGHEQFSEVLSRLPAGRDLLVVNYDEPVDPDGAGRVTYRVQREEAQAQLSARMDIRKTFLVKPEGHSPFLDVAAMTPDAPDLVAFDVVGVTEKELGGTFLDKLVSLARLRRLLDESGCGEVPLHVFGSLDPLLTPLYFMAGGELFDGLSWLRYAYADGLAVHPEALSVLAGDVDQRQDRRDALRRVLNLRELHHLKHRLARWAHEQERYDILGPRHQELREVYEIMTAKLAQRR